MYTTFKNIKIRGIQAAAPARVYDNINAVDSMGDRRAKKQIKLTGIKRRHLMCKGQRGSDLSAYCAEKLIEKLNWNRDEIKILVNMTQEPELRTPSTAMIIQKRLGLGIDCIAFDVNLGCTAYTSGLIIVMSLLENIKGKALLLTGEGSYFEFPDTWDANSLLYGQGGSATAIEYVDEEDLYPVLCSQKTDGSRFNLLYSSHFKGDYMDGNAILVFALDEVSREIINFKNNYGLKDEDVDYYILHQAQKLVLDGIAAECNIDSHKVLESYSEYGNTTGNTIPMTISHNSDVFLQSNQNSLFLCGFGVGLAWSCVYVKVDVGVVFPVLITDYCYGDLDKYV